MGIRVSTHLVESTFIRESWTAQSLHKCVDELVTNKKVAIVTHGGDFYGCCEVGGV